MQEPEHVFHMHRTTVCPACKCRGNLCEQPDGTPMLEWHGARRVLEAHRNPGCDACRASLAISAEPRARQLSLFDQENAS